MYLYLIKSDGYALSRWKLGDAPLTVGRDECVTIRIPDYRVSGRHFAITLEGDAFILQDLDSKNGTWVNGLRVTRRKLKPDDRIVVGRTCFTFEAGLMTAIQELEAKELACRIPFALEQLH